MAPNSPHGPSAHVPNKVQRHRDPLATNVARFSGNEIMSGLGDVDASDGIGVAGEEGLLSASADRPRDDARTERIERAEAIR